MHRPAPATENHAVWNGTNTRLKNAGSNFGDAEEGGQLSECLGCPFTNMTQKEMAASCNINVWSLVPYTQEKCTLLHRVRCTCMRS